MQDSRRSARWPEPDKDERAEVVDWLREPTETLSQVDTWGGSVYAEVRRAAEQDRNVRPKDGRHRVHHAELMGRLTLREQLPPLRDEPPPPGYQRDADMVEVGFQHLAWLLADAAADVRDAACWGFDLNLTPANANAVFLLVRHVSADDWNKLPRCAQLAKRLNVLKRASMGLINPQFIDPQ